MKLVLVYLIKGKTEKYHQKLVREVGPKFGENYMIENPLPSHITFKSPFELSNSKVIEKILKEFCKNHTAFDIEMGGFGNFRRFVSFLKIKLSRQVIKINKELLQEVKKIDGIKLHRFDINWKPHATISYGNTKNKFNKIWNYLKKLDKPKFNLKFDNITILKKIGKHWKIYKEFKLKKA